MRFYIASDEQLSEIANNIRSKYSMSESLIFPNDFINSLVVLSNSNCDTTTIALIEGTLSEINNDIIDSLRSYTFIHCDNLMKVKLTNCSNIGMYAFGHCFDLQQVDLPSCITLESHAFAGCTQLSEVNLPKCQILLSNVFYACTRLISIALPECSYIGPNAFSTCTRLFSLTLMSNSMVQLASNYSPWNHFYSTPIGGYTNNTDGQYGSVYVPESLVTAYQNDPVWASISARIVGI